MYIRVRASIVIFLVIEKMAPLEAILVPALLLSSITLDVVTMCARGWILGYHGDVVVLQLSPWSFCRLSCLHCAQEKPSFECYAMHDWTDSEFGKSNPGIDIYFMGGLQMTTCFIPAINNTKCIQARLYLFPIF